MSTAPLVSMKILSLAEQFPGPYATMLLADMGAEVIMVERPGIGDPARQFPPLFRALNRGKRSVALDLKSTEGMAQFHDLAKGADVIVEGSDPANWRRSAPVSKTCARSIRASFTCRSRDTGRMVPIETGRATI